MRLLLVSLWFCGVVIHGTVLWHLVQQLRWPYRFRAWTLAWGSLFIAVLLVGVRRLMVLWWYPMILPELALVDTLVGVGNSLGLAVGFWQLTKLFRHTLPTYVTLEAEILIDQHSTILAWSPYATTLFGWTADEAVGQTLMQTIMPSWAWEAHRAGLARLIAATQPATMRTFVVNALHKPTVTMPTGYEVSVEIDVTLLAGADGPLFRGCIRRLVVV